MITPVLHMSKDLMVVVMMMVVMVVKINLRKGVTELQNVKSFTRSKSSKPIVTPRKARKLRQI